MQIYVCILCLQAKGNRNASQMWHLGDGRALKIQHFKKMYLLGRPWKEDSYHNERVKTWEPQQKYSGSDPHDIELGFVGTGSIRECTCCREQGAR